MPNGDSWDGLFYSTLKLMIDSYSRDKPRDANLKGDPWDGLFYPTPTFMIDSFSLQSRLLAPLPSCALMFKVGISI